MTFANFIKFYCNQIYKKILPYLNDEMTWDDLTGFHCPSIGYMEDGHYIKIYADENNEEICIDLWETYTKNDNDPLVSIGIPKFKIKSGADLVEAIKEEIDLFVTHYEMLLDDL